MNTFDIAVVAGDGIGKEVVPKASAFWKRRENALASGFTGTRLTGAAKPTSEREE